ncbi:M48 family metallopeptidase [Polyangium jinanense]|uniref:M48 family metallopeptidase n=1 Tax=Polyangium jinanense TaxID=2829994 RepID=A0A9X3XAG6_9BACT|nr:M48 family metallopeptidase [Polyangium jinanense]MDC3960187.1 M48 family metallopeptidase [Polyangium jinanense]MDC3986627.1 M48 family metallopeptidase [Polyangium jinanense]
MAQVGTLDFKGFIENRKEQRAGGVDGGGHAYAYVSDRTTRAAFDKMKPVELAVAASVRFFKAVGKSDLLGHAVKVGTNQFPRVHGIAAECAQTLGIATPTVYILNNPQMNAATYGTNDDSFIMVHSALVDHFSDEELRNVIGHECGHIHNSHVVYLTAMHYLKVMASRWLGPLVEPAMIALSSWSRRAEVTCDRAGLLCCKSLDVSQRTFAKLALGSAKLYAELNMEAFLAQYEEGREGVGRYRELLASHPYLPKRVMALRTFAESELYKKHIGHDGPGLSMEEVDEKVHDIIKVVG